MVLLYKSKQANKMKQKLKVNFYAQPGYEKPEIVKITKMNFMFAYFNNPGHMLACRQCSSCHGCR